MLLAPPTLLSIGRPYLGANALDGDHLRLENYAVLAPVPLS